MADPKKPRSTQRLPFDLFLETQKALGLSFRDLSVALGYDSTAHRHWQAANTMPKPAALACEALRRRNGDREQLLVLGVKTRAQADAIKATCQVLGINVKEIS